MNLVTLKIGDSYLGETTDFSNELFWLQYQVDDLSEEETKAFILDIMNRGGISKEQDAQLIAFCGKFPHVIRRDFILRLLNLCELIKIHFFDEA